MIVIIEVKIIMKVKERVAGLEIGFLITRRYGHNDYNSRSGGLSLDI